MKDFQRFYDFCVATGMQADSAEKYCDRMRLFKERFGKLPDALGKSEYNRVFSAFENNGYAEATKNIYKITMRKYFKWKLGRVPNDMKPYLRIKEYYIIRPLKTMLDGREMLTILELCRNQAEKAFMGILMETGCRIDELISAKFEDLSFDRIGGLIIREGKGKRLRRIRIIKTRKLLKSYLKSVNKKPKDRLFDFRYDQIRNLLRCRIEKRLGKHLSPHMFRKMVATRLANHMTEYQLCQTMGWVIGSKTARHYVFLSGRDVDPVLMRVNKGSWT